MIARKDKNEGRGTIREIRTLQNYKSIVISTRVAKAVDLLKNEYKKCQSSGLKL